MSFLSAWWAAAALLAAPIILLYLLKMRRQPTLVSSTLLWQQVLVDMRANTPFQKLRRNLLLLLQLLALAALVAALCRPIVKAVGRQGSEIVVVLDASASMQASDGPDGESRFEYAKEQIGQLIGNMRGSDQMMLIVAGPPGLGERTALTTSKGELRGVLRRAKCYDASAAVADALRLAGATLAAEPGEPLRGRVCLVSDGVGVTIPDTPGLGQAIRHVRTGVRGTNVAITALTALPVEGGGQRVTVGLSNFGDEPVAAMVDFYYGEENNWIDSRQVDLDAGAREQAQFTGAVPPGRMWVRVRSADDRLELDSEGYVLLPERRPLTVRLVSAGNPVLTRFLAVAEHAGMLKAEATAPSDYNAAMTADVTIFDGIAPADDQLPDGDVLLLNPPQAAAGFTPAGELIRPQVINVAEEADVLRQVKVTELKIARAGRYTHDGTAIELVASTGGPMLAYTAAGASRRYLIAFHLADSTWSTDPGLLILLNNIFERAAAAHHVGRSQMVPTGMTAQIPAGTAEAIVTDPDRRTHKIAAGVTEFAATTRAGFYEARRGDRESEFAANLLSPIESDIGPRVLSGNDGDELATTDAVTRHNRPLWPILAAAALAVLMIEWYCYHKRIGM